jgi:hypothetical protein
MCVQESSELLSDMIVRYSQQVRSHGSHAWNYSLQNRTQNTTWSAVGGVPHTDRVPQGQESQDISLPSNSSVGGAPVLPSEGRAGLSCALFISVIANEFFLDLPQQ